MNLTSRKLQSPILYWNQNRYKWEEINIFVDKNTYKFTEVFQLNFLLPIYFRLLLNFAMSLYLSICKKKIEKNKVGIKHNEKGLLSSIKNKLI